jgi:hypothetical protein
MATTQSNISVDFSEAPVKAGASFAVDGDMSKKEPNEKGNSLTDRENIGTIGILNRI